MHPAKMICGVESSSLEGRTIVLGVTGSIAAVRSVELARSLARRGASVIPVMTDAATHILHPNAMHYACGEEVVTTITGGVEHVAYCGVEGVGDLLLVAPATANTLSKIACGIDDTSVTTFATTALGSGKPVLVVPAMHEAMYNHMAVVDNIERLREMGVFFVEPVFEEGAAKIAAIKDVVLEVERVLGSHSLDGKKILITGGATSERIDPIRIITNRASGRTGIELALEAYRRGASVTIVHTARRNIHGIREIMVESAEEMTRAVLQEASHADVLISAAAISDFTVDGAAAAKIRSDAAKTLTLKPMPKLLDKVRIECPHLIIIGFKAETNVSQQELIVRARESMDKYGLAAAIANDVGTGGIGEETNQIHIVQREGVNSFAGRKDELARQIITTVEEILQR
ncbi:bifunctional phosphopantothenoylcysteine decarboxylase/phosphopantothenate--cysteine ligase CoaBC [Methanosarcinales archaeon]|nr:MAG: bifunctional phosphopantothenoylcysteine decarboxylase/phosphopantothenate--cysteine ligase CoaBC [Methanosarcinales archaeon]